MCAIDRCDPPEFFSSRVAPFLEEDPSGRVGDRSTNATSVFHRLNLSGNVEDDCTNAGLRRRRDFDMIIAFCDHVPNPVPEVALALIHFEGARISRYVDDAGDSARVGVIESPQRA